MNQTENLTELCGLFSDDASLRDEVVQAYEQPAAYFEQFADDLVERTISEPRDDLAWFALIDGLARRELLWELDKPSNGDVIDVVVGFIRSYDNWKEIRQSMWDLGQDFEDEGVTEFARLNSVLEVHDVQIVWIYIDSDSYPLALLKFADLADARRLADTIGMGRLIT